LGKAADPRTIKSYLKENDLVGDISVAEYLGRLAYEATTIINAEDYGRTIYDLSIRRNLITIGEDMVNIAYEAPVDMAPRAQIEDAERRLFELAETGRFNSGFQGFAEALKAAIDMAGNAYQRAGHLSGLATGLDDMDRMMGGLQNSDLVILAGRPGMGKTALATNIAYNVASAWRGEQQPDGSIKTVDGGIVGFFSLEMSSEQLATRVLAGAGGGPLLRHPSRQHPRGPVRPHRRGRPGNAAHPALHRPDRRHLHRPAGGAAPGGSSASAGSISSSSITCSW
jgi:replicative DNA helicase